MAGELTLSNMSVTAREESVSKHRRAISYIRRTLSIYSLGLAGSSGTGCAVTGRGLRSHSFDICMRFSSSRTLVKYWSRRSRSWAPTVRLRSPAWPPTASKMLRPRSMRRSAAVISAAEPPMNIRRKMTEGFSSVGIMMPPAVHERLREPRETFTPKVIDWKRVR